MINGQFGIGGWGYTALEYAIGLGAIAVVVEIAKLI
jgi:hypothetical protein